MTIMDSVEIRKELDNINEFIALVREKYPMNCNTFEIVKSPEEIAEHYSQIIVLLNNLE